MDLYSIITIKLLESKIFNVVIFGLEISTEDFMFNFPHSEGKSR